MINADMKIRLRKINRPDLLSTLDAGFNASGELELEGYDLGKLPEEVFGDSDYEYWVTLPVTSLPAFAREASDELGLSRPTGEPDRASLMDLIRRLFLPEGELKPVFSGESAFMKWLEGKGIPYNFCTW